MTTEDRKANDLNELVKTALALAEQMRQSGLTMKTAVQSLLGEGCTEIDILAIANEAKRLTYSNPQLAFTLVQLGRETAIRISSALGQAMSTFQMATIHKARGQYQEAIEQYQESLALFEERQESRNVCATLTQLGAIYIHLGQH